MSVLLVLATFLVVFSSCGAPTSAQPAPLPEPVLDTGGNELRAGTQYYILPAHKDKVYGALDTSPRNGFGSCPIYVRQSGSPRNYGVLAKFAPADGADSIQLTSDLNVRFNESNHCPEQPIWTLGATDQATGQRFVTYGGILGNPGVATINNWFRIDKAGDGNYYKFTFCPGVCATCRPFCGDIGFYSDFRWLVLGGNPLVVKFKKA